MNLDHYTGFEEFKDALDKEKITIDALKDGIDRIPDDHYLETRNRNQANSEGLYDICMRFRVPDSQRTGRNPEEFSLGLLYEINATHAVYDRIEELLETEHDGKYQNVVLMQISPGISVDDI